MTISHVTPDLTFAKASELWLASRTLKTRAENADSRKKARFIRPNTLKSYEAYIDTLNLFFGSMPLHKIDLGKIREYQEARVDGAAPFIRYRRPQDAKAHVLRDGTVVPAKGKTPCPASPKKCNQEITVLKAILCRAGCWTEEMNEYYEPFEESFSDCQRALTADDQQRWLEVARSQQRWSIVHLYSMLAFETSMSTDEMRALKVGDINLSQEMITVRDGKNRHRPRPIPLLSAEAKWAAEQLLARTYNLGARGPLDYLFPFWDKRTRDFDPTRHMTVSGIKKPWNEVRFASRLDFFVPYGTRHTAITRWAESGMDMPMIMSMAGHVSPKMSAHYTHISMQAKRRALAAGRGNTAHQTNQAKAELRSPSVRPPVQSPASTLQDILQEPRIRAEIQAEIARQVALALEAHSEQSPAKEAPRLLVFPGGNRPGARTDEGGMQWHSQTLKSRD